MAASGRAGSGPVPGYGGAHCFWPAPQDPATYQLAHLLTGAHPSHVPPAMPQLWRPPAAASWQNRAMQAYLSGGRQSVVLEHKAGTGSAAKGSKKKARAQSLPLAPRAPPTAWGVPEPAFEDVLLDLPLDELLSQHEAEDASHGPGMLQFFLLEENLAKVSSALVYERLYAENHDPKNAQWSQ